MPAEDRGTMPLVISDDGELRELVSTALAQGAPVEIRATGSSMEPTIPAGALVQLVSASGRLRVGDVVLVLPAETPALIHRVRRITASTIVTMGDNRVQEDHPVPVSAVAGMVRSVTRAGSVRSLRGGTLGAIQAETRRQWRRLLAAIGRSVRALQGNG